MRPVSEIRRENLELLIEEEGTIPALNEKLGRRRNDPSLSFIRAQSVRSSTGKPYLMGDKLARDIESKLKLGRGWMDTDHTGMLIDSIDKPADGVRVPELADTGTMGDDPSVLEQDVIIGGLTLAPDFVRRLNPSNPMNLKVLTGHGDSMLPTIAPGDKVLIDEGVKDLYDGIYVLRSYDTLFIKRVNKNLKGAVVISSDNPTVKLSEELDGSEQLEIVGRVVYVWHGTFV